MSDRILVATRKGLFTVVRGLSGSWTIEKADFVGDNVSMVLDDPRDGSLYASLDHGHFGVKVHRAPRGGAFTEIAAPVYPPKPEGNDETDMWGRPLPWSLVRIWSLETGAADEPGTLWCGTIPGGLFRSRDRGASWEMIRSLWDHPKRRKWMGGGADLPGIHTIALDPRDGRRITIAVSTGGLWHTSDSGATWTQRGDGMRADHVPPELTNDPIAQDVHRFAQCAASPGRIWIQHHNGIFVSSDEGRTFREITGIKPSVFGFGVVVHPQDPDTAWFVPAVKDEKRIPVDGRLVVTRTRDGGRTFETLSDGLPQQHAYDLIYRHGLDIDGSGARLAMGSTTGNLFVSESQGERWHHVAGHLPPIHTVRFMR